MTEETILSGGALVQPLDAKPQLVDQARLSYIDNLRVGLIALVIVGHMAITYGAPLGEWYYREEGSVGEVFSIVTALLLGIGASFLLGLFYMIAGYFTPRPCDRKGARHFIVDRLIRLGIPLVIYAVVINPLVTYWAAVHGGYQGAFRQYVSTHLPDLKIAAVGPLWFVELLLVLSIFYALAQVLSGTVPNSSSVKHDALVPGNRSIVLFALCLGVATFLVRIWAPFGWWWEPPHLEPAHFPQYISLYVVGIFAYRNDWFARITAAQARFWGWIALAFFLLLPALAIAAGALSGEFDPTVTGGLTWLSLAYSFWEAIMGVAMVITVLVWSRSKLDRQGKLAATMSACAYTVYVLHPLLIVPLALALSGVLLSLDLKFVLVSPLAVALCFLVGYVARTLPVVRRIL